MLRGLLHLHGQALCSPMQQEGKGPGQHPDAPGVLLLHHSADTESPVGFHSGSSVVHF